MKTILEVATSTDAELATRAAALLRRDAKEDYALEFTHIIAEAKHRQSLYHQLTLAPIVVVYTHTPHCA